MMIQLLTLLFLISPLTAHPPSRSPVTHTGLLHYLQRRNLGCYSGCQSCSTCDSSCSSSCNSCVQNCPSTCQSNCQICQQPVCQQSVTCGQCCNYYCPSTPSPAPPTVTVTPPTVTVVPPTVTMVPPTWGPPGPGPTHNTTTVITNKPSSNNTVNVRNNVESNVSNYLRNENHVHVPININNVNKMFVSNNVVSKTGNGGGGAIISTTSSTESSGTTTTTTTTTVRPPHYPNVIIITQPYHGYYIHPVVDIPCVQYGYSCNYLRSSWSGNICGGWSGYGSYWGSGYSGGLWADYGTGLDWGGFSGCRTVSQNCGACGSYFYNSYARSSWQYSSCYGCFI